MCGKRTGIYVVGCNIVHHAALMKMLLLAYYTALIQTVLHGDGMTVGART